MFEGWEENRINASQHSNIGNDRLQKLMNFGFAYLSTVGFGSVFKNLEITISVLNVSKPRFRFVYKIPYRLERA